MNKFAEKAICPRCHQVLRYDANTTMWVCGECDSRLIMVSIGCIFAGYVTLDDQVLHPAAPTEPSATVKWAREIYNHAMANIPIHEWHRGLEVLQALLAAAPSEVKDD